MSHKKLVPIVLVYVLVNAKDSSGVYKSYFLIPTELFENWEGVALTFVARAGSSLMVKKKLHVMDNLQNGHYLPKSSPELVAKAKAIIVAKQNS